MDQRCFIVNMQKQQAEKLGTAKYYSELWLKNGMM